MRFSLAEIGIQMSDNEPTPAIWVIGIIAALALVFWLFLSDLGARVEFIETKLGIEVER
jgi:hypothetical protein